MTPDDDVVDEIADVIELIEESDADLKAISNDGRITFDR
jgi:hypothetical protein